jgi:hypothetical protein
MYLFLWHTKVALSHFEIALSHFEIALPHNIDMQIHNVVNFTTSVVTSIFYYISR